MPATRGTKFESKMARERREAARTEIWREAENDKPRVDLGDREWDWNAVPPKTEGATNLSADDIDSDLERRIAEVIRRLKEER